MGGTVWGALEDVALLEGECHCGLAVRILKPGTIPSVLSVFFVFSFFFWFSQFLACGYVNGDRQDLNKYTGRILITTLFGQYLRRIPS